METKELFIVNVTEVYQDGSIRVAYSYPFANEETAMVYYVQMCKHQYDLGVATHFENIITPLDGTVHRKFYSHFENGARMMVSMRSFKDFSDYSTIFLHEPSEKRVSEARELLENRSKEVA